MRASNIHLFLATQKQSTQLCQSTAFCWEILSIKAKLFFFSFFSFFRECDGEGGRMKEDNSLCVLVGYTHDYSGPSFPLQ